MSIPWLGENPAPTHSVPWYAITRRDHIILVRIGTKCGIYQYHVSQVKIGEYMGYIYMGHVVQESIVGSEYYGPPYIRTIDTNSKKYIFLPGISRHTVPRGN